MTSTASNRRRYLALFFPFLPADRLARAARRRNGCPPDAPFALVEKRKGAICLAAVDRAALALGMVPGLSLADARARLPDLGVADHDPPADARFLERIADGCDRYTPMVALDPPDGLLLDISGCAHLFGGEGALRDDLAARLGRLGLEVLSALADTPDAAHALARYRPEPVAGATLGALPVEALGLDGEETVGLRRAGFRRLDDLEARPSRLLAARFGEAAPDRLRRIAGGRDVRITPRRPEPALMLERRFAEPIGRTEGALAAIGELVGQAAVRMEAAHRGGRRFEAQLFRTDGLVRALRIETGLPVRDARVVMRLFDERLAALADPVDPGFGFDLVRLSVPMFEPLAPLQLPLEGGALAQGELAQLLDRLSTRLGRHRVRRLAPRDSHVPEQAAFVFPAIEGGPAGGWPDPEPGEPPLRPTHLFDPPQPIEVMAGVPDGPPSRFRWRRELHEVTLAEGPERIGALWWRRADNAGLSRDYYRVEDGKGRRFWLFRLGLYGREAEQPAWYIHGLFA
ncbi:Nucleotidyltransferase/DNA polymerase involved in DNA repair-like protein [Rhizorhabdus wittichii RW1]|uniref:Nucleotidyltransferase/DNA polymerase involved in DNA repair-like protein n=1 Tax=Rhizorhabdus wittichii (strain DSM 6014 / CCUG 31198 / JCM 15750 / NBRC 105917 / EY 4224 / RW1) TaxID=392499 RepID=A0A9J9H9K2_RHIWR|nr:Nucleotidyltransferase/DNA polymerase involved in DNA repair-like protein [Rhizorhabdus wittichii RW1]